MKISATFINGQTISRNTSKNLTHAFQANFESEFGSYSYTGFAGSEELAIKSAKQIAKGYGFQSLEIREVTIL